MNTSTSLEQIKAQFDRWRHNKDTLGSLTPVELRRQAVGLCCFNHTVENGASVGTTFCLAKQPDVVRPDFSRHLLSV
ncbi:hypothetical protein [Gayadomonas joobiniege]|uniref:hypothetical protein n=1 Tax=Gayadomonas joobiniege TaxID=1234606 RepID=UPI000366652D|nr:hypothetical protein [Gayadomonas joobiniege]